MEAELKQLRRDNELLWQQRDILTKSLGHLQPEPVMCYQLIYTQREMGSVATLFGTPAVSVSVLYLAHTGHQPTSVGIWTDEGWLYVAAILDCFSRMIVGRAMGAHREEQLAEDDLVMALKRRNCITPISAVNTLPTTTSSN